MQSFTSRIVLLGPPTIVDGNETRLLRGRSALILALLASAQGSWLSWEVLATEMAAAKVPSRGAVHTAVSRLRTALGPGLASCLESGPNGYSLTATSNTCDLAEFEGLCRQVTLADVEGQHRQVQSLAGRALDVWSASPFESILGSHRLDAHARVLERERLQLIDTAAVAALATDDGRHWIARLRDAAESEPLRETSSVLLAQCQAQAGHRVAALRSLQVMRRSLLAVGLAPSARADEIEQNILIGTDSSTRASDLDTSAEPESHAPVIEVPFTPASLGTAKAHLASSRFSAALREVERFLGQQFNRSNQETAEAWIVCALASDALMRPMTVRTAVAEAVKAALAGNDQAALRQALALSPRATAPNESNQPIVWALEQARLEDEDRIWAMGAISVNVACGAVSADAAQPQDLAMRALKATDNQAGSELRAFAVECWLRVTEAVTPASEQERIASRCLRFLSPESGNYAVVVTHRARRALRTGNRAQFETDIATLERSAAFTGLAEDLVISMQMRAAILTAEGERAEASAMIESAARLAIDHPVHQEVADIQRWWLHLDQGPHRLLANLRGFVSKGRSPAYQAMLMYTLLQDGDHSGADVALRSLAADGGHVLHRDGAYPSALAGMAETAARIGATDFLVPIHELLAPFSGEMIIGPGHSFVIGAADRFLGLLANAMNQREEARRALQRAETMERKLGFARLAQTTAHIAESIL